MKPTLQILLTVFFCSCISLENCTLSDNDPKPKTELEKLPPVTQEGKNTFGCLVNGKAWYTNSTIDAGGDYQLGSLYLYGIQDTPSQGISLNLREESSDPLISTGTYSLLPSALYSPYVSFRYSSNCIYGGTDYPNSVIFGALTITKFDKVKYIISGLFEFTITHPECDTLEITNGRFDIRYAP